MLKARTDVTVRKPIRL